MRNQPILDELIEQTTRLNLGGDTFSFPQLKAGRTVGMAEIPKYRN